MSPKVSIVVICYRLARYLSQAIDSCLGQSYPAVETIVVNDGSDDHTEEVAESYGDRITYIRRENGGPAAARNTGIAAASGRYIKFLDADDFIAPQQVRWQVEALERSEGNSVSLTALRNFHEDDPGNYWDHVPAFQRMLPDIFKDHDGCAPHCMLAPTKLVRAIGGFAEDVRYVEDWEFCVRLGLHEPAVLVDSRTGCFYRRRSGSISTQRTGTTNSVAKCLMSVHDTLRETNRSDWYGPDLLNYERGVLRWLLVRSTPEPALIDGLFQRVEQLRRICQPQDEGRWLPWLVPLVGYRRAERFACAYRRWKQPAIGQT